MTKSNFTIQLLAGCVLFVFLAGCTPGPSAPAPAASTSPPAPAREETPWHAFGPSTYREIVANWDTAVIARLAKPASAATPSNPLQNSPATYEIVEVLKGNEAVTAGTRIDGPLPDGCLPGDLCLLVSGAQNSTSWTSLIAPLTPAERTYLATLFRTPDHERTQFYLQNLEAKENSISRDALVELERVPYTQLQELRPVLKHDEIVAGIEHQKNSESKRRLYFRLLGICGGEQDLPLLEKILQSTDRRELVGLDGAIGCYLSLKGAAGLPLIERFLQDKEAGHAEPLLAVAAIRFHLNEVKQIEREPLLAALRTMLARPELADLVIPDLIEQQDWTVSEVLFDLFRNADPKTEWIKVPVVTYLRKCPLPEAKHLLEECQRLNPDAVRRSEVFFPDEPAPKNAEPAKE